MKPIMDMIAKNVLPVIVISIAILLMMTFSGCSFNVPSHIEPSGNFDATGIEPFNDDLGTGDAELSADSVDEPRESMFALYSTPEFDGSMTLYSVSPVIFKAQTAVEGWNFHGADLALSVNGAEIWNSKQLTVDSVSEIKFIGMEEEEKEEPSAETISSIFVATDAEVSEDSVEELTLNITASYTNGSGFRTDEVVKTISKVKYIGGEEEILMDNGTLLKKFDGAWYAVKVDAEPSLDESSSLHKYGYGLSVTPILPGSETLGMPTVTFVDVETDEVHLLSGTIHSEITAGEEEGMYLVDITPLLGYENANLESEITTGCFKVVWPTGEVLYIGK